MLSYTAKNYLRVDRLFNIARGITLLIEASYILLPLGFRETILKLSAANLGTISVDLAFASDRDNLVKVFEPYTKRGVRDYT